MPGPDTPVVPPGGPPGLAAAPRAVGGYRLLRLVGEGAMSRVYLGYDPAELRPVAVKLLADHLAGDRQFVSRFYREARMSRAVTHPNLVRGYAHGYDVAVGRHYLILEYVDGPNALALLGRVGRLPAGAVVRVGAEVGRALGYLHARGLVHRDVKPENVLLGAAGAAKLGDLGLAKRLAGEAALTASSHGVGTPDYMPYEQAVNGDLVDGRSDLFALGATLYHLLTGRVPFRGETHEEIVREKARDAYVPARAVRPDVPPVLDAILTRTLARDPRARFQSAADLVAALAATGLTAAGEWPTAADAPDRPAAGSPAARTRADLVAGPAVLPAASPRPPAFLGSLFWPAVAAAALAAGAVGVAGYRAATRPGTAGAGPAVTPAGGPVVQPPRCLGPADLAASGRSRATPHPAGHGSQKVPAGLVRSHPTPAAR